MVGSYQQLHVSGHHVAATHWLPTVNSVQKPWHIPHIMSHGTPTSMPATDSTSPRVSTWLLFTLWSSSLPHTHTSHHLICFHAPQKGHDPLCLRAHTHLQLDYACQESRPTHNNIPVYCKSTSLPDSELHASKNTHSIITSHNKNICKINEY